MYVWGVRMRVRLQCMRVRSHVSMYLRGVHVRDRTQQQRCAPVLVVGTSRPKPTSNDVLFAAPFGVNGLMSEAPTTTTMPAAGTSPPMTKQKNQPLTSKNMVGANASGTSYGSDTKYGTYGPSCDKLL